jgi:hypothetical protein
MTKFGEVFLVPLPASALSAARPRPGSYRVIRPGELARARYFA